MVSSWLTSDAVPGKFLSSTGLALKKNTHLIPYSFRHKLSVTVAAIGAKYDSLSEKRLGNKVMVKPLCESQGHSEAGLWLGFSYRKYKL